MQIEASIRDSRSLKFYLPVTWMAQIPFEGLLQILAERTSSIPSHTSSPQQWESADNSTIEDEKGTRVHWNSHICDLSTKLIPAVTQVVFVQLSGISSQSLSTAFPLNNQVESTSAVMARWWFTASGRMMQVQYWRFISEHGEEGKTRIRRKKFTAFLCVEVTSLPTSPLPLSPPSPCLSDH